jgi:hypothetical protein
MPVAQWHFKHDVKRADRPEWTFEHLLGIILEASLNHLESLKLFKKPPDTEKKIDWFYFPIINPLTSSLQTSLRSLICLEFSANIIFNNFHDFKTLLGSLPKLEELIMNAYSHDYKNCTYSVSAEDTSLALRRLKLTGYDSIGNNPDDCLLSWLATTGTPQALVELTIHYRSWSHSLRGFLHSVRRPLTMIIYFGFCKFQTFKSVLNHLLICGTVEEEEGQPQVDYQFPCVEDLVIYVWPTDSNAFTGRHIETNVIVERCMRIRGPSLRSLSFIFPPPEKDVHFQPLPPGIHGIQAQQFPRLSSVNVGFHDGSDPEVSVQRAHDCRYFRDAFPAVDVTFSEDVVIHN